MRGNHWHNRGDPKLFLSGLIKTWVIGIEIIIILVYFGIM